MDRISRRFCKNGLYGDNLTFKRTLEHGSVATDAEDFFRVKLYFMPFNFARHVFKSRKFLLCHKVFYFAHLEL